MCFVVNTTGADHEAKITKRRVAIKCCAIEMMTIVARGNNNSFRGYKLGHGQPWKVKFMNSHVEDGSVFVNQKVEESSVSVNQEYKEEKRTFPWKIAVSGVLVVVGVASAIIYAYAAGYLGNPFKLAVPGLKDLLPDSDSKEFDVKSEERFFFFVRKEKKFYSVSTKNSIPVGHDIKKSGIEYLKFSTFCKYESNNLPIIVSLGYNSDNLRKLFLYNYKTGNFNIINFDKKCGNADFVSLSLKENKIVFTTLTFESGSFCYQFWIANIDGTNFKKLETKSTSDLSEPQFALNDSVILYITINDKTENVIESFNLKTSEKKVFYNGIAKISNFLVSPDGKKIVVHTASKLEIIDLTNGDGDKIFENIENIGIKKLLKWSKDGSEIFYQNSKNNLWKLKLNPKDGEETYEQVKDKTDNPIQILN